MDNITLEDIVETEESINGILECANGVAVPMWSLIRWNIIQTYTQQIFENKSSTTTLRINMRLFDYVQHVILNNIRVKDDATTMFYTCDSDNLYLLKNKKNFHKEIGYFEEKCSARPLTLFTPNRNLIWTKNKNNENFLIEPLRLKLCGRLFINKYFLRISEEYLHFINDSFANILGIKMSKQLLNVNIYRLALLLASYAPRCNYYAKIFDKYNQIKLLITLMGCYGGYNAILNFIARQHGIVTAEYQHGLISKGHIAYNQSYALCRVQNYLNTFPLYFLGYGKWWGEQINIPSKFISIGYPHRSELLKSRKLNESDQQKDILILGQDDSTVEKWLELCAQLATHFNGKYRVVFRPHPSYRILAQKLYETGKYSGIQLEVSGDIYDSLSRAIATISDSSTGLFEAIGLSRKIFARVSKKTQFDLPNCPFEKFASVEELVKKINSLTSGILLTKQINYVWETDWSHNYENFIRLILECN